MHYNLAEISHVAYEWTCCVGDKPDDRIRPCNSQSCPAAYYDTGPWSPCDTTCGGGQQSRIVVCTLSTGSKSNEAACSHLIKPASTRSCNAGPCEIASWQIANRSACNLACDGTLENALACVSVDGDHLSGQLAQEACGKWSPPKRVKCTPCPLCATEVRGQRGGQRHVPLHVWLRGPSWFQRVMLASVDAPESNWKVTTAIIDYMFVLARRAATVMARASSNGAVATVVGTELLATSQVK